MRDVLGEHNRRMLREITVLSSSVSLADASRQLEPYRQLVLNLCQSIEQTIHKNLERIEQLDRVDLLEEIISDTSQATQFIMQLSAILLPPIQIDVQSYQLSMSILYWLHSNHSQRKLSFPSVMPGSWGVLPFLNGRLPIYYIPYLDQCRLLFQPLLFHEFGHVLYALHRPEMDELVKELQQEVITLLTPGIRRNDSFDRQQTQFRQVVAYIWYQWIQEFYCDAVGFMIGGPSFLHAFATFLSTLSPIDFHNLPDQLSLSSHPVTWLRVQFLVERAAQAGYHDLADKIDGEWRSIARAMNVVEDYYGFYDRMLEEAVMRTIEDMLVETNPVSYEDDRTSDLPGSPINLLNLAWNVYHEAPDPYSGWESLQIDQYLQMAHA